jgi:haloalkane dehalogenase
MELTKSLKTLYPFSSNYLQIDGNNYHYIDEGEGEVIILVHGNPTWSFYYRNVIKDLSKKYRVIAPDHIGCGLSDKPEDYSYTLKNRIKDLGTLIKFLDIKKYSMLVHDWGGAIGFGHAVEHVDQICKMIILNTGAFTSKRIPFSINLLKGKKTGPFLVKYFNAFCYPATFMSTEKKLSNEVKKGYLFPYQSPKERIAISEFVQDIPMDQSHQSYYTLLSIEQKLPSLTQEKLILWGGKDFCFNDEFFSKWRSLYPQAKYIYYKDAGHYVIEDETLDTLKQINQFLEA